MSEQQDVRVLDDKLLAEIDLMTELMATASGFDGRLCEHVIDAVLRLPNDWASSSQRCTCRSPVRGSAAAAPEVSVPRRRP